MQLAVLGGANLDLLGRSAGRAVAGDSNPGTVRLACGGVARNVCENLARLGARTTLITALGDDWPGELLRRECAAAGIDVSHILCAAGRTGTYLAAEGGDGELLAAVNDMDILRALTPERLAPLLPVLRAADAVVFDANLPAETVAFLAARCGDRPLFADPVSTIKAPRLRPALPYLRCLKPNRAELRLLSGEDDPERGMDKLLARGAEMVCVSLGAQGACLRGQNGVRAETRPPHLEARDVTGAGDALFAGLIWALLDGRTPAEALRFGTGAALLTLQYSGAVRPDLKIEKIDETIKEYHL